MRGIAIRMFSCLISRLMSVSLRRSLARGPAVFPVVLVLIGCLQIADAAEPQGHQAGGNFDENTALLARFGELLARERAYHDTVFDLYESGRGNARYEMDSTMLSAVLGEEYFTLYDEVLPRLEALGQPGRRDDIALRFDPDVQKRLIAGERVAGINEGAVNNFIAHYKIAIEQMDTDVRQLLLAESHLMRRAGEELDGAIDDAGQLANYVAYIRASGLVSAQRLIKGYVQPRCKLEGDAIKRARAQRNDIDDNFYFNEQGAFQTTAQRVYDAAEQIETEALALNEDGSHC